MARTRGILNKKTVEKLKAEGKDVPAANRAVASTDNETTGKPAKAPLTDAELQGLFEHHKGNYEKALAAKKKADATFKDICKKAKAESVSIADIKLAIDLEDDGGEERLREKIERTHRVARWLGLPVGTQPSFFDEVDRTPSVDKAEAEGHRSGLKGESANPPPHFGMAQQQAWLTGWHTGQKVLTDRIRQTNDDQRGEDAAEFDAQADNTASA